MNDTLRVESCYFQRKRDAPWEYGIIVNNGDGPIIDMDGKVVPAPIENYRTSHDQVMTVVAPDDMFGLWLSKKVR